jgi:Ca2+-binding RTX toxin-like protein
VQGTASHANDTVIQVTSTGEYLAIFQGVSAANVTYMDFISNTAPANGSSANEILIGTIAADSITGGGGSDVILGWGGDDTITVGSNSGAAFTTVVDGGAGTDTLRIATGRPATDYTISYSGPVVNSQWGGSYVDHYAAGGTYTFQDVDGGVISFKAFEQLYVGNQLFQMINDGAPSWGPRSDLLDGAYSLSSVFLLNATASDTANMALLFSDEANSRFTNYSDQKIVTGDTSKEMIIKGSEASDYVLLNGRFASYDVNTGGGNDQVAAMTGHSDSIRLGGGNDIVFIDAANLASNSVVDGGEGIDTLAFSLRGSGAAGSFNLSIGSAIGFENIFGTAGADTITGNSANNELRGGGGNDILRGEDGNDTLVGDVNSANGSTPAKSWSYSNGAEGNDQLYGGAGSDNLFGGAGEDFLDGGVGADTLAGGAGADTFILRTGDGGSAIADADIITDFQDGTDVLGLADGLRFTDLVISQGTGSHAADSIIQVHSTGEYLALLTAISATTLTDADFE